MTDIVLTTFNARYTHTAFGLRCLRANLGALRERTALVEFDQRTTAEDAARHILEMTPRVVGIGVAIWNVTRARELAAILRRERPGLTIVAGGPELGHELDDEPMAAWADCIVQGEGEMVFRDVCHALLAEGQAPPRLVRAPPPDLARLASPYGEYDATDIAQRIVYVETTRGCAFACAYCTSAVAPGVRCFPRERVRTDLEGLWARGLRQFKFADRSFNWDDGWAADALDFFLARLESGLRVHMEMRPDLFTERLWERVARFPDGALHFEVGVQTLDPDVASRIGRPQSADAVLSAVSRLVKAGVDVHADLIAGLPGETEAGFLKGLDRLAATGAGVIQINTLKRLKGTPLAARADEWGMVFETNPPYAVIETPSMDRAAVSRLAVMARFWELIVNRGRFREELERWRAAGTFSAFRFLECSQVLYGRFGRAHAIPLCELAAAFGGWMNHATRSRCGSGHDGPA